MKKLILFIALAIAFISCKTDEPEVANFSIDPTAMVYVKPKLNASSARQFVKSDANHLTPLEIVKQANNMRFYNKYLSDRDNCAIGFAGKDTISEVPAFLRYGTDILNQDGFGKPYLVPDLIYAYDCVVEIFRSNNDIDTVAYVPNECFKNAELKIKSALEAKDTASVYVIFKNEFKFIPITGAEYKELKKKGLN